MAQKNKEEIAQIRQLYPLPLGLYRHFRGTIYQVIGVSLDADNLVPMVVYHEQGKPAELWTRQLLSFLRDVNNESGYEGPRYLYLSPDESPEGGEH